jgi:hypothetical protein
MSIVSETVLRYTFSTQYSTSLVELNNLKIISIHGTSDGWLSNGDGWLSNGDGWQSNGDGWLSNGDGWLSNGDGWLSRVMGGSVGRWLAK